MKQDYNLALNIYLDFITWLEYLIRISLASSHKEQGTFA